MKLLKSLFISVVLAVSALAQANIAGSLANGLNNPVANALALDSLVLIDTSGTNQLVTLYDNLGTSTTNRVFAAYTNRTTYPTNIVTTFTDQAGVSTSFTNAAYGYVNVVVPAATNQARVAYQVYVPANGTATINPPYPLGFNYGLQIKTAGTALYNLAYKPLP